MEEKLSGTFDLQKDIEKLFNVYFDWINKLHCLDKNMLRSYQERILATYDQVETFFKMWMENTQENRHKFLKLLGELLKLI